MKINEPPELRRELPFPVVQACASETLPQKREGKSRARSENVVFRSLEQKKSKRHNFQFKTFVLIGVVPRREFRREDLTVAASNEMQFNIFP